MIAITAEALGEEEDEEELEEEVGTRFAATPAVLGACFVGCVLLLTGLPPLSGFVAKLALLAALFAPAEQGATSGIPVANWVFIALLLLFRPDGPARTVARRYSRLLGPYRRGRSAHPLG